MTNNKQLYIFKATTSDSVDSHKTFDEVILHISTSLDQYQFFFGKFIVRPQDESEVWVEFITTNPNLCSNIVKHDSFFKCVSEVNELNEGDWHLATFSSSDC